MHYTYYDRKDTFFEMYIRARVNSLDCVIGVDAPGTEDLEMVLYHVEQDFQDWLESKTSKELVDLLKFTIDMMVVSQEEEEDKKKLMIQLANKINNKS